MRISDGSGHGSPLSVLLQVQAELDRLRAQPHAARTKAYRDLLREWHPDKKPDNVAEATRVFQYLQDQRGWFLK